MLWPLGALGIPLWLPLWLCLVPRALLRADSLPGRVSGGGGRAGPDSHKFEVNRDLARNSEVGGTMPVGVPLDVHP